MRGRDHRLTHELVPGIQVPPTLPVLGVHAPPPVPRVGAVFKDAAWREQCVAETI